MYQGLQWTLTRSARPVFKLIVIRSFLSCNISNNQAPELHATAATLRNDAQVTTRAHSCSAVGFFLADSPKARCDESDVRFGPANDVTESQSCIHETKITGLFLLAKLGADLFAKLIFRFCFGDRRITISSPVFDNRIPPVPPVYSGTYEPALGVGVPELIWDAERSVFESKHLRKFIH